MAPSNLIVSPFSILMMTKEHIQNEYWDFGIGYVNNLLSTMLSTSCAYSSGFPRRLGLGTVLARKARTLICGILAQFRGSTMGHLFW